MVDDKIRLAKEAANTPGYGSGERMREQFWQEANAIANLPDPAWMAPVIATPDPNHRFICSFGNSGNDLEGRAWHLVVDHKNAGGYADAIFPSDAMLDAIAIAALCNAWRMGILLCPSRTASDAPNPATAPADV